MDLTVRFDCDELLKKFEQLGKRKKFLQKKILRAILRPLKREVKQNLKGGVLKKRSGALAEQTDIFVKADGSSGWLGTREKRRSIRNAWWIHADNTGGYEIAPKKKDFMQFKIGSKWIRKKASIFVPGRPTVTNSWKKHTTASVMAGIADEVLQKELNKIMEHKK